MNSSKIYKILNGLMLFFISNIAFAGFCDYSSKPQTINGVWLQENNVVVSIIPGLSNQADAALCTDRNAFLLQLSEKYNKELYSLVLSSSLAGKKIMLMYCGGCVTHPYLSGQYTIPVVTSLKMIP